MRLLRRLARFTLTMFFLLALSRACCNERNSSTGFSIFCATKDFLIWRNKASSFDSICARTAVSFLVWRRALSAFLLFGIDNEIS